MSSRELTVNRVVSFWRRGGGGRQTDYGGYVLHGQFVVPPAAQPEPFTIVGHWPADAPQLVITTVVGISNGLATAVLDHLTARSLVPNLARAFAAFCNDVPDVSGLLDTGCYVDDVNQSLVCTLKIESTRAWCARSTT